jgi:hypothetical protein
MERARQRRLQVGSTVFFGGICYGTVRLMSVIEPEGWGGLMAGLFIGKSSAFWGPLRAAYPSRAEYEQAGVHWRLSDGLGRAKHPLIDI